MSADLRSMLLAPDASAVLTAQLAASSVRPAANTATAVPIPRTGSAALEIDGTYTGHADTEIEVEYVDEDGVVIPLAPQFVGSGDGSLDVTSMPIAETITLTCIDAGREAQYARAALDGLEIVAREIGPAGSGIEITIDRSGIVRTATEYSVLEELPAQTRARAGSGLYFGQPVTPTDEMPATALRISFGLLDQTIYRTARRWTGGAWEYLFEPALRRRIDPGERIYSVTGTYTATVRRGATTETYSGLQTPYDLLSRLRSESALVTVEGVLGEDRSAGGIAARELELRTDAHYLPPRGEGSAAAMRARVSAVIIESGAATEIVEARCFAVSGRDHPNARLGHELWQVSGSVSGDIGAFATGETVARAGRFAFRIDPEYPDGYGAGPRGRFSVVAIQYAPRTGSATPPPICPVSLALGPEARDQQITLVYTRRPTGACACDGMRAPDLASRPCLTGASSGGDTMDYPPAIAARMADLWAWRRAIAEALTSDHSFAVTERQTTQFIADAADALERTAVAVADSAAGLAAWDSVYDDLRAHVVGAIDTPPLPSGSVVAAEAIPAGRFVLVQGGQVRLAVGSYMYMSRVSRYNGYAASAIAAGDTVATDSLRLPEYIDGTGFTPDQRYALEIGRTGVLDTSVGVPGPGDVVFAVSSTRVAVRAQDEVHGELTMERVRAQCDAVLAAAGISPLGKGDASSISGDGCWRDRDDAYYWAVTGSEGGSYMPAFTNVPYFSCRRVEGAIVSTREFALQVNVACPDSLREGDTIRLAIGDAAWPATYQVGDRIYLPIVSAEPLTLRGGVDASLDQRWTVEGTLSGPRADYVAPDSVGAYSAGGLAFSMTRGARRYAVGDRWRISAQASRVRWRRDGGAWSAPVDAGAPIAIGDGITAHLRPGLSPAFGAGDRWVARVLQPHGPASLRRPGVFRWRWAADPAHLDVDLGAPTQIDAIVCALLDLPASGMISVQLGSTPGGSDILPDTPLQRGHSAAALALSPPLTARHLRVTVSGALGGIGWLWAGRAVRPSLSADTTLRREYAIARGAGVSPRGRLISRATSALVQWSEAALSDEDIAAVVAAVDGAKQMDDAPIIWIAQPARAQDAIVGRVVDDSLRMEELTAYRALDAGARRWTMSLEMEGAA